MLLDSQLASLYGVATKRLNEQVRRNASRFPDDFLFQLNKAEFEKWRSQIATSNSAAKMGLRRRPYAFTEHGAIMAATVLNSPRAVEVSLLVVRAFVKLRQFAVVGAFAGHLRSRSLGSTAAMMAKVVPDLWNFDRLYNEVIQYG